MEEENPKNKKMVVLEAGDKGRLGNGWGRLGVAYGRRQ